MQEIADNGNRAHLEKARFGFHSGFLGRWVYDLEKGTYLWDDALNDLVGLPPHSLQGDFAYFLSRVEAQDRESILTKYDRAMKVGEEFSGSCRLGLSETSRHTRLRAFLMKDAHGVSGVAVLL